MIVTTTITTVTASTTLGIGSAIDGLTGIAMLGEAGELVVIAVVVLSVFGLMFASTEWLEEHPFLGLFGAAVCCVVVGSVLFGSC